MKTIKLFFFGVFMVFGTSVFAQSADEIIANYFEITGGKENWAKLKGIKMNAIASAQGMEIPVEIVQTADGKQAVIITFQGQTITQLAFDGETMWSTNFMTMQAEKSDSESTENMKKTIGDFPSPLFNYKNRGYSAELVGTETIEGTETFKIKFTQKPLLVDGKEEPNISYYYFDSETYIIIQTETEIKQGPMAGQKNISTMSEYEEVEGLYFPFSMGMMGQSIQIKSIELNPALNDSIFAFPGK
ncbi:MAG TPA: outer membrane lipoprotein-sorting protein [Saprospiraceae bacterium]|nr:outer membrane lipoprotein-sorting protein [Saprospiraceae bacterium]